MPEYVPPPEIQFYAGIPHGSLRDTSFFSINLNNSRTIRVYTPPDYAASSERYPVVLFHDGLEFISLAQANNVIDYLISQNRIAPIIAVFVPPVNRREEYATNLQHAFTAFIATEVMPWVDQRYRTRTDPASRAVLGSSDGGNISLWLGYAHPEIFGNIAALSSNVENNISTGFQNSPKLNLKFYLDMGTYDIAVLLTRMNNFLPILQAKGYVYQYLEFHEGHSWGNWRAHIDNALEMFFPGSAVGVNEPTENPPQRFGLHQNYPNPFNRSTERSRRSPTTAIEYEIAQASQMSLAIYNIQGQLVQTLFDGMQSAGRHAALWEGKNNFGERQASGIYFYRLQIGGRVVDMRRMILLR
ncbi:T9SS C-terminal target domain-containing protein [candidate division KSB1 bacterium]|nr:T9SS C-terminal target domain-containing protein [candidate division KSB1 bacterium]